MTQPAPRLATYDDYLALPEDGPRMELLEGRLEVVPGPDVDHKRCGFRLARLLADFVEKHDLGEVFIAPFDVLLGDHDTPQPDIMFVTKAHAARIVKRGIEGPPDLAIEILSPGSRSRDWVKKQRIYQKYGVLEYWLVDPDARSISVLVLETEGYEPRGDVSGSQPIPSGLFPGLPFTAADLF